VCLIDQRENQPLPITRFATKKVTLFSGDYTYLGGEDGLLAIERKSIDDLFQTCASGRERFERELHRLRGFRMKRLLIIGSENEILYGERWSKMSPKSVMSSLFSWECKFDIPVVFSPTPESAARLVERWIFWHSRMLVQDVNNLFRELRKDGAEPA